MEWEQLQLLKNGHYTEYFMEHLVKFSKSMDSKVEELNKQLLCEYEKKKNELLELKKNVDYYKVIQNEVNEIKKTYHIGKEKDESLLIKSMPYIPLDGPTRLNKNILSELQNSITITIHGGECIKKTLKNNIVESIQPMDMNPMGDFQFQNQRLFYKRHNQLRTLDNTKALIECDKCRITIDFNEYRVNLSELYGRYFFMPNENKLGYSFINHIMVSNDGENWELLSSFNMADLSPYLKSTLFKMNLMNNKIQNDKFYRYVCLESLPIKEIATNNQINKFVNKLHIPLCGLELYGDYYSVQEKDVLNDLESKFDYFFELYVRNKVPEKKEHADYDILIKLLYDSLRDLQNQVMLLKMGDQPILYNNSRNSPEDMEETMSQVAESEYIIGDIKPDFSSLQIQLKSLHRRKGALGNKK